MARFTRIWASKWLDHVEAAGGIEAVSTEWQEGIDGLSGAQIKRAIEHCRRHCTWPPSIAEFRQAAGDGNNREQRAFMARAKADEQAMLALPSETSADQRARGKAHLAALKAKLKSAHTHSDAADEQHA